MDNTQPTTDTSVGAPSAPTTTAPAGEKANTMQAPQGPARFAPRPFPPRTFGGPQRPGGMGGGHRGGPGGRRGGPQRDPRAKPEFDQKIITIRRVTRVASGGRRFSFSVALVAGNRKGMVGVGLGKAGDTSQAIDKAMKNAKKNMIRIPLTKNLSIPHMVDGKYSSARVLIIPAPGRGLVAGSSLRNVLELAGITDVTAKVMSSSKNKLNIARAAVDVLSAIKERKMKAPAMPVTKEAPLVK